MELRHLRAFVAVAEERHFRRAAERLGVTQPPLSILIQALEQEVGTLLLRRTRRSVELTEAGALFLAEARDVLNRVQRATKVARDVEQGHAGRLEVGFTGSCAFNPVLWRLFRAFRERYSQIDLILTELNTLALLDAVSDRKLDAAFLRPPVDGTEGVVVEPVLQEEMVVALPADHPLASEPVLPLTALRKETILLRPRPVGAGLADAILAACRDAGFRPLLGQQSAPQMSSILSLVAAGLGVSIVPASMQSVLPTEIAYRALAGEPVLRAPIALAFRTHCNAAVTAFVDLTRARAKTQVSLNTSDEYLRANPDRVLEHRDGDCPLPEHGL